MSLEAGQIPDNSPLGSQIIYMLGDIRAQLTGLTTSLAEQKNDHKNFVQRVTAEHESLKLAILTGDANQSVKVEDLRQHVDNRVENIRSDLGRRIDCVEDATAVVKTSYNTLRTVSVALASITAGIFAFVQWVVPLLQHAASVAGH